MHQATDRKDRPLCRTSRRKSSRASHCISRPPPVSAVTDRESWSQATKAVRPKSKEIPAASGQSRRDLDLGPGRFARISTIRTGPQPSPRASRSRPGEIFLKSSTALVSLPASGGAGFRFLTQTVTSPTLARAVAGTGREKSPGPVASMGTPHARLGESARRRRFGRKRFTTCRRAKMIVALDSDFLYLHPAALRHARDFAARRRVRMSAGAMSRFYVAEPTPSITGSNADHRLPVGPRRSRESPRRSRPWSRRSNAAPENVAQRARPWICGRRRRICAPIRGASMVIAGETQPPAVHALVAQINASLGNIGVLVFRAPVVAIHPTNQVVPADFVEEMGAARWKCWSYSVEIRFTTRRSISISRRL